MKNKNEILLTKILLYCNEIEQTMSFFESSKTSYHENPAFRNSCNMCILQIGEIVSNLDQDILAKYPYIQWKKIKGMRNIFAHTYHKVDLDKVWNTIIYDIPDLKKEIDMIIKKEEQKDKLDIADQDCDRNINNKKRECR